MPSICGRYQVSELCTLYLEACQHTKNPEAQASALTNLAELMETSLADNQADALPKPETLDTFQHSLQGAINPALSNAILLASGPIMALHALRHHGQPAFFLFEQRLRSWGAALADALSTDNAFDTRHAAARALRSLSIAVRSRAAEDAAYLPLLLALYTALVDDDEDVREVAAGAAAAVLSPHSEITSKPPRPLVAVDAADALLSWLLDGPLSRTNEFRTYVACRLAGSDVVAVDLGAQDIAAWISPAKQLAAALRVDESLFVVEEQNLFIDEVREAERWSGVLARLEWDYDELEGGKRVLFVEGALADLKVWTERALEGVVEVVRRGDDGPLGWASSADAFAFCYRVLACGKALGGLLGEQGGDIVRLLGEIREAGLSSRLHGLLLAVMEDEGVAEMREQ